MAQESSISIIDHEDGVGRLCTALNSGGAKAIELARTHVDACAQASDDDIRAAYFTIDDAATAYARMHGFDSWAALRLDAHRAVYGTATTSYDRAVEAVLGGCPDDLAAVIEASPEALQSTPSGRDPLLLVAVGAREPAAVRVLLAAGADVHAPAHCGCTPIHRAAYGHPPERNPGLQARQATILEFLLAAGARLDGCSHGQGGIPLAMALFWGHQPQARIMACHDLPALNLRLAAGLGRMDVLEQFCSADTLAPAAGTGRAFYRPHDGFPEWQPSDDRQEILDEALSYAARNGQIEALARLLHYGADIDGRPYCGTALHHVAHKGPFDVVVWLVEQGAEINSPHGMIAGSTPLHIAAAGGHLETVAYLVAHGADPRLCDQAFDCPPIGYAEWAGMEDVVDYLLSLS